MRVELVLTEVAPVGGICAVLRTRHLFGLDDEMVESELLGDTPRDRAMPFRITPTVSCHPQGARAERPMCGVGEVGTVDAAAVGDDERWQLAEREIERCLFSFKRGGERQGRRFPHGAPSRSPPPP